MTDVVSGQDITRRLGVMADAETASRVDEQSQDAQMVVGAAAEQLRFWSPAIAAYQRAQLLDPGAVGPRFRISEIEANRTMDEYDLGRLHNRLDQEAKTRADSLTSVTKIGLIDLVFLREQEEEELRRRIKAILDEVQNDLLVLAEWLRRRLEIAELWPVYRNELGRNAATVAEGLAQHRLVIDIATGETLTDAVAELATAVKRLMPNTIPTSNVDEAAAKRCQERSLELVAALWDAAVQSTQVPREDLITSLEITADWARVVRHLDAKRLQELQETARVPPAAATAAADQDERTVFGGHLVDYARVKAYARLREVHETATDRSRTSSFDAKGLPDIDALLESAGVGAGTTWARKFDPAFEYLAEREASPQSDRHGGSDNENGRSSTEVTAGSEDPDATAETGAKTRRRDEDKGYADRRKIPRPEGALAQEATVKALLQISVFSACVLSLVFLLDAADRGADIVWAASIASVVAVFTVWLYVWCRLIWDRTASQSAAADPMSAEQTGIGRAHQRLSSARSRLGRRFDRFVMNATVAGLTLGLIAFIAGLLFDRASYRIVLFLVLVVIYAFAARAALLYTRRQQAEADRLQRSIDLLERWLRT